MMSMKIFEFLNFFENPINIKKTIYRLPIYRLPSARFKAFSGLRMVAMLKRSVQHWMKKTRPKSAHRTLEVTTHANMTSSSNVHPNSY